ncbi:hypothetical protein [Mycolicibacterium sp.]|uniref:hypothetical protein n=1 Tax=Mycolicibacterium sp. TaxID=2320850 RepID=UPI0037C51E59
MAEETDGISAMRQRMARARRTPPAPRHAAQGTPVPNAGVTPPPEPADTPAPAPATAKPSRPRRASAPRVAKVSEPLRLAPDEAPVNLAIRVRRPLDDRLADMIHRLRGRGVRTSKVELIEMMLWELSGDEAADERILERLGRFRTWAPRSSGAALPGGEGR